MNNLLWITFAIAVSAVRFPLKSIQHKGDSPLRQLDSFSETNLELNARPLTSDLDITLPKVYVYYTDVSIGQPPQQFSLMILLDSNHLSVYDSSCSSCASRTFNSSMSQTFTSQITGHQYSSSISLDIGTDRVSLGGNLITESLSIWILKPSDYAGYREIYDGYLVSVMQGLQLDYAGSQDSLVQALYLDSAIQNATFAIYLNDTGSSIAFGETEKSYSQGDFIYVETASSLSWSAYTTIQYDGEQILDLPVEALFITDGLSIWLPAKAYLKISSTICYVVKNCSIMRRGFIKFDCDSSRKFPDIIFNFESHSFPLSDRFYIQRDEDGLTCYLLVRESGDGTIHLNQQFFYAYYINFDFTKRRIGIAPSVNYVIEETSSGIWIYILTLALIIVVVGGGFGLWKWCYSVAKPISKDQTEPMIPEHGSREKDLKI